MAAAEASLDRTLTIVTPESTALSFVLAGPGSRFAALLLDTAWQAGLLGALLLLAMGPLALTSGWPAAAAWVVRYLWPLVMLAVAVVFWGYHAGFETWWAGQTPGKRALGLRVVREGGYAIGFGEAALRNILRLVDLLPVVSPYLLGALAVTLHHRHQRLGDLVAGTLVIRELPTPWLEGLVAGGAVSRAEEWSFSAGELARVTPTEMEVVGHFLRRQQGLPLATRRELAARIAQPLRARFARSQPGVSKDEDAAFLEALQTAWTARRRRW
ncbi:MAG: RDD family protein [Armatimonadetes bacterium]|nr:RDD family protein [Armatimonadota bacterium]